ncbi:hypothetical protein [Gordonia hydrophobica]|uniref:Lipoprotein n=1 Tax=Gordonia hydrophobica TaxID=40516 RepID=A0ABZ2U386_9ACTN|nr:hypothetical protein [Gordonia hydrophobica]MBM7367454.1 hypothetical protein [Gordonia hydrophobica]
MTDGSGTFVTAWAAMKGRFLSVVFLLVSTVLGVTGCSLFSDRVTDCEMSATPVTCQRDERFDLAGTRIVVDELATITKAGDGQDQARVEAQITLDGEPTRGLHAQLHVVEPLTDDDLVIDPDKAMTAGRQTIAWDFSNHGYAPRMQFDQLPPNIFLVFTDGDTEVTVNVQTVEYS